MKIPRHEAILRSIAGVIAALFGLSLAFSAAYFLTRQIYLWLGVDPVEPVRYVIVSFTGLFLLTAVVRTLMSLFKVTGWSRQMMLYGPLLQAMERISRGDFSVRVTHPRQIDPDHPKNQQDPITQLFDSVNVMAEELNQMEVMRQEFISNVSHEIQSPLTSIRGFAHALQNEQLSAQERAHYLGIIEAESMRLSKLSDNLLALASLEADNMRFEPRPYRLDKQLRRVVLTCEPQWTSKNIEMEVSADEVSINADEDLLNQVWVNLIHNAIKFTPQYGRIQIDLHTRDDKVEFTIADSGIGIAAEDQPRVFERFYKADKSRNRAVGGALGGSGLGLSIAKKIVEMHHGEIDLVPAETGATFRVRLPRR